MSELPDNTIVILSGGAKGVAAELVRLIRLENTPQAIFLVRDKVRADTPSDMVLGRQLVDGPICGPSQEQIRRMRQICLDHPGTTLTSVLRPKVDFTSFNPRPNKRQHFKSK